MAHSAAARAAISILLAAALVGSLGACSRSSALANEADDLIRAIAKAGAPDQPVSASQWKQLDGLIDDLSRVPDPTAEELALLRKGENLALYRTSMDEALALADDTGRGLSQSAEGIVDDLVVRSEFSDPFVIDTERVLADMTKSTTCSLAHELLTFDEAEFVGTYQPTYDLDGGVAAYTSAALDEADDFLLDQLAALSYSVADVSRLFPTLDAVKRVYEISSSTIDALDEIPEADNPATTRAYYFYFRLCVLA